MRNRKVAFLLTALSLVLSAGIFAQTQTEVHNVPFASGVQNMFGPSTNAVTINQNINFFNESWNESFGTGSAGIVTILGQQFGAAINGQISGTIGMDFALTGFNSGSVEVDYPINVTNTVTNNETYDPGDDVTISTDYQVLGGAELETVYPQAGEATLDFYFQMGFGLSATVCAFGCTSFPLIPNFNTGLINVNIFTINQTQADFFSISAGPLAFGPAYSYPGLPLLTDEAFAPADPLGEWGLSGMLNLPYAQTSDVVNFTTGDINACGGGIATTAPSGTSIGPEYLNITLSVFDLLGNLPAPVGPVLGNLSGSEDLLGGLATVSWNFFTAEVVLKIENKQCFDFTPRVYGQYQFPVPVDYTTTSPSGATSSGTSSIVNVEVGGDIVYKFPCYYFEMDIQPTYSIDGIFRNHTYDSVSVDLDLSALGFGLVVPPIEITPEINVPEICIPIPYPCPSWSCPWCWCTETVCTPAFTIPAVGFDGFSLIFPPLLDVSIPIADILYDWYDNTWSLEGFSTYSLPSYNFTMTADTIQDLTVPSFNNVTCFGGNNGSINTTMTQTGYDVTTFNYTWSNGSTSADPSGLVAGTYALILYDGHGCNYSTAVTIAEPTEIIIADSIENVQCNGSGDGMIDITASGGTESGAYNYAWSTPDGSGIVAGAEDQFTLGAGTYTVVVTDDNSCSRSATFTLTEPEVLGQSAAITHVNCKNDLTGEIQVSTFGGTAPYLFSWDSGETTEDLYGIAAGPHTLTITDVNSCVSSVTYNVTEPADVLTVVVTSYVDVDCKGNLTGSIDITTAGGNIPGGYSYSWVNAAGFLLPTVSEDLTNAGADTYTVIATDSKGCQASVSQVISEPLANLASNPILTDILCFGASTGSVDPVISGGTLGYTYTWSNGSSAAILSAVPVGTYGLTVVDANGCTDAYTYVLSQPSAPLGLTLAGVNILCFGASTGEVSSTVTGGTAPYSYLWGGGQTTPDIASLPIGNYSLTVTDNNGCVISDNLTLTQPLAPLALSTVVTDVDCHGNNTGSIDLTITGGTAPYLKTWWNGGSIILSDTTEDIGSQYANSYTVLVTDGNGCIDSLTSVINEPLAPVAISGIVDDVNCFGLNDGAIDATVTDGTGPYTYSWSSGQTTEDIAGVVAGTYTLTATDSKLCVESMTFTIIEPNAPLAVTTAVTDVLCNGDNDGEIESFVEGGTLPYTYAWSNGETTPDIISLTANTYTVTVTDAQGCIAFTGATVNEPTALVANYTITDASCYGYNDGEIQMIVTGGVAPYSFDWGNQNNIFLATTGEILDSLIAEDYFIRVKDANGCLVEQIVTVGEPEPFISSTVVTEPLCFGGSDGSIDVTITGGTAAYSSVWSNGLLTEDAGSLTTGTYTYVVTDAQGCIINDTVFVDQPKEIQISYDVVPVSCIDQTDADIFITPFGGIQPYTYFWSTGGDTQHLEDVGPGTYTLTITDDHLCSAPFTFEIEINPEECLMIPNTFTPNGDNYNDTWVIENLDLYPNATVKVFNKWGNEIYDTEIPYTPWDGMYRGNPLPSEVYYYIIILGNDEGNEYTGTITILR